MKTEKTSFIGKHPRITILLTLLILSILLITLVETALSLFFPYSIHTIGHIGSENARRYGWGYNPGEFIKLSDPDTGEIYNEYLNNHGWRDKDRTYENPEHAYRILILGDSNTFGGIVPNDRIYTWVLEERLRSEAIDAQVINISYGGWGTDQELEALRLEGIRYRPNLIILQFCTNDLTENAYYREMEKDLKPFYYDLDEKGHLARHENRLWFEKRLGWKDRIKRVIDKSQILRRLYGLILHVYKLKTAISTSYSLTQAQLDHLGLLLDVEKDEFLDALKDLRNQSIDADRISSLIEKYHQSKHADAIMRILEKRWFNIFYSIENCVPSAPDPTSYHWRLYFSLVGRIHRIAQDTGAELALFSDNEMGHYLWERYWYRIKGDEKSRENYLAPSRLIRDFCRQNGIGFIENHVLHSRARNDPHPNVEGNRAMASNIYQYLMRNHAGELLSHKYTPISFSSK